MARIARVVHQQFNWVQDWEGRGLQQDIPEIRDKVRAIATHVPDANVVGDFPMFGAVVGSVQSGKTAAMIGLISHLFDKGYDVVTVFTGTKNDLYTQTTLRMKTELFEWGDDIFDGRGQITGSTHPSGPGSHKQPPLVNGNEFFSPRSFREWGADWQVDSRRLLGTAPTLFVAKKRAAHILPNMRTVLSNLNTHCQNTYDRQIRWAIIDDECDEVTAGTQHAQSPTIIRDICDIGECVYIGFSATPQANLFSFVENPNHPRDFCCLLRYPHFAAEAEESPSADVSYLVHDINGMYCGGWVFHNWCEARGHPNFFNIDCLPYNDADLHADDVSRALAHYLVSGAARWLLGESIPFQNDPVEDPDVRFPEPHTMLINPDISQVSHWRSAAAIINTLNRAGGEQETPFVDMLNPVLRERCWRRAKHLIAVWMAQHQQLIEETYNDHETSFNLVDRPSWDPDYNGRNFPSLPEVLEAIQIIMPEIKMKVLNGETDDVLDYDRKHRPDGRTGPPPDVYTIAIGGINMGRGLTLKGLCTTLFLTGQSADDTTIQRQRWFGYRGPHIEHCRVFVPDAVWESAVPFVAGLAEINANDEDLKEMIAHNENSDIPPDPQSSAWAMIVNSNMSNKIGPTTQLVFEGLIITKWATPESLDAAIATSNIGRIDQLHSQMIDKGMPDNEWTHPVWNQNIGYFCGTPFDGSAGALGAHNGDRFTALEIADFLDEMNWNLHDPQQLRDPIRINPRSMPNGVPGNHIHRTPAGQVTDPLIECGSDPYLIAAYLRLWHYGYQENNAGVGGEINDLCDSPPPEFNVLIRRGGRIETHTFPTGSTVRVGAQRRTYDSTTGHIRNLQFGAVNPTPDYGSDFRPDDIRDNWNVGQGWVTDRRSVRRRANDEPGLLLIYLMEDQDGGHPMPLLLYSIPDSGPMYRYV